MNHKIILLINFFAFFLIPAFAGGEEGLSMAVIFFLGFTALEYGVGFILFHLATIIANSPSIAPASEKETKPYYNDEFEEYQHWRIATGKNKRRR